VATHGKKRRRIVDHLQAVRVGGLAERNESDAKLSRGSEFALGVVARVDLDRARRAAPVSAAPPALRARRRND
jgi:hypothetical protein